MLCPIDKVDLVMAERNGIAIDYCPKCRGVWLDRGELDKIIARAAAELPPARAEQPARRDYTELEEDDHLFRRGGTPDRRRDSFPGDLFDV